MKLNRAGCVIPFLQRVLLIFQEQLCRAVGVDKLAGELTDVMDLYLSHNPLLAGHSCPLRVLHHITTSWKHLNLNGLHTLLYIFYVFINTCCDFKVYKLCCCLCELGHLHMDQRWKWSFSAISLHCASDSNVYISWCLLNKLQNMHHMHYNSREACVCVNTCTQIEHKFSHEPWLLLCIALRTHGLGLIHSIVAEAGLDTPTGKNTLIKAAGV